MTHKQVVLAALAAVALQNSAGATDYKPGEKLALFHCGRCHVVNERNKYGGIGSTPSFGAMRTLEDWEERFDVFYVLAPHPAFTQVEGLTEPFPIDRPSPIYPLKLTVEDIATIKAFAATIPPKDLGAPVR